MASNARFGRMTVGRTLQWKWSMLGRKASTPHPENQQQSIPYNVSWQDFDNAHIGRGQSGRTYMHACLLNVWYQTSAHQQCICLRMHHCMCWAV